MTENDTPSAPPDLGRFHENRCRFPPEQLLAHAGQHLAWSLDGLRILASGHDLEEVETQLTAAGIDASQVVFDFLPPADMVWLG